MSFSQGSLFRFHLEFRGNILPTLDTFPQLHPKTFTFEGVLESEWGHHEAGFGMRSGVFCSLGKRMKVLDTAYFYQISSWNYPYWFLWRYIGFRWLEAIKSPEKETWTCGFSCGFLKQQQVGQVGLIDYYCTLHWAHIAIIHGRSTIFIGKWSSPCGFVRNQSRAISPTICGWHEQGKLQGIVLKCFRYVYIYTYFHTDVCICSFKRCTVFSIYIKWLFLWYMFCTCLYYIYSIVEHL